MKNTLRALLSDIETFSTHTMRDRPLRAYQTEAARALLTSTLTGQGDQFAVVFSRQAGKDEMLAQLLALLLLRRAHRGGTVIVAAPITKTHDRTTIAVGKARATFLSAAKTANARGQTADLALIANEAQDIDPAVWDAVFDPMAASTNATTFVTASWRRP